MIGTSRHAPPVRPDPERLRGVLARRRARLLVARFRPLVVCVLAVLAAGCAVQALRDEPPATVPVLVAAEDLPAGGRLGAGDVETAAWPSGARPRGALTTVEQLNGAVLAGPVRRGEPFTDARILGPGLLTAMPSGSVAVPVRIADAEAAALVRNGDLVDLYAATDSAADLTAGSGSASASAPEGRLLGSALRVLARVPRDDGSFGEPSTADGGLLLVAASSAVAGRLAGAASRPIALALHADAPSGG